MAWIRGYKSRAKRRDECVNKMRECAQRAKELAAELEAVSEEPTSEERDAIAKKFGDLEADASELEALKDELSNWLDSMPENVRGGDKGESINVAIDSLDSVHSEVESLEVPSMPDEDELFEDVCAELNEYAGLLETQCDEAEGVEIPVPFR